MSDIPPAEKKKEKSKAAFNGTSLLKILSGPHQGAEIELPADGEAFVVGSDEKDDIVLFDTLIAPRHFEIQNRGDAVIVKPLSGRLFLNGKLVINEEESIKPFEFITAGTTQMVVGPLEGAWPNLSALDAPELEDITEAIPASELVGTPLEADVAEAIARKNREALRKRRQRKTLVVAGLVVLGGLLTLIFFPSKNQIDIRDVEKIVRAEISDKEYLNSVELRNENGQLILEGYVPTNMEARDLRTDLVKIYPNLQFRVRSEEKIIQDMEDTLRALDAQTKIVTIQPGSYAIMGYIYNTEGWQKIRNRLLLDVPGVKKVQDDILSPERVVSEVQDILAQYGLSNEITVVPQANRLTFKGDIGVSQQENWRNVAEEFIEMFSDFVPVEFEVRVSGVVTQQLESFTFFESSVQGVSVGRNGLSWVTLSNGKRYFVGSYLPSGYTILSIGSEGIEFAKDGNVLKIPIEELDVPTQKTQ